MCPVCKRPIKIIPDGITPDGRQQTKEEPLYQISYRGTKEYVSPRCSTCFDRMMERRQHAS